MFGAAVFGFNGLPQRAPAACQSRFAENRPLRDLSFDCGKLYAVYFGNFARSVGLVAAGGGVVVVRVRYCARADAWAAHAQVIDDFVCADGLDGVGGGVSFGEKPACVGTVLARIGRRIVQRGHLLVYQ